jgi:hypothetical protein
MFRLKSLAFFALTVALMTGVSTAPGQVSVSIGVEPVCPYGYFDYTPYACAPYGYYGPDFFVGGVFIGSGPWFHGYKGPVPERGEQAFSHFHPNEARDGRGHVVAKADHDSHAEHSAGYQKGKSGGEHR